MAAGDDAVEGGGGAADQLGVGRRLPPARSHRLLKVKVDSVQLVLQGEAELLFDYLSCITLSPQHNCVYGFPTNSGAKARLITSPWAAGFIVISVVTQ